jgi:hypothetical protein
MVRYSFLVRLFHPLLHAGLSRRIFDHLIRPLENTDWNRQANLFRRFEIDNEFKLRRLCTERSAGLAPFKILSEYRAALRNIAVESSP